MLGAVSISWQAWNAIIVVGIPQPPCSYPSHLFHEPAPSLRHNSQLSGKRVNLITHDHCPKGANVVFPQLQIRFRSHEFPYSYNMSCSLSHRKECTSSGCNKWIESQFRRSVVPTREKEPDVKEEKKSLLRNKCTGKDIPGRVDRIGFFFFFFF